MKKILLYFVILGFISCAYSEVTKEYFLYWGLKGNIKKIISESYNVGINDNVNKDFVSIQENEYDKDGKSISETFYSVFKGKKRVFLRYKFDYNDKDILVAKISLDEKGEIKNIIYIEENEMGRRFTSTRGKTIEYIIIEHKNKNRIISTSNLDINSGKITETTKYKFDKFGNRIGWYSTLGNESSKFEIVERDKYNNPTKVYISNSTSKRLVVYSYEYYN